MRPLITTGLLGAALAGVLGFVLAIMCISPLLAFAGTKPAGVTRAIPIVVATAALVGLLLGFAVGQVTETVDRYLGAGRDADSGLANRPWQEP